MRIEELFVGAVTFGTGMFIFVSAASNSRWFFNLPKAKALEEWMGRGKARLLLGGIGLLVVALGVAIAVGYGPNKHKSPRRAISVVR